MTGKAHVAVVLLLTIAVILTPSGDCMEYNRKYSNQIQEKTPKYQGLTNIQMFRQLLVNMGIDPEARSVPSAFIPTRNDQLKTENEYASRTFSGYQRSPEYNRHQVVLKLGGGMAKSADDKSRHMVLKNKKYFVNKSRKRKLKKKSTPSAPTTTTPPPTTTTMSSMLKNSLRLKKERAIEKKRWLERQLAKQDRMAIELIEKTTRKPTTTTTTTTTSTTTTTVPTTTTTTPPTTTTTTPAPTTTTTTQPSTATYSQYDSYDMFSFMTGGKKRKRRRRRSAGAWSYVNPKRYRAEQPQRDQALENNSLGGPESAFQPSFSEDGNTIVVKSPKLPDMNVSFDVKNLTQNHDCVKVIFKPVVVNRKFSDPNANTSHRCQKETKVRTRRRRNGNKCTIITIKLKCRPGKHGK